MNGKKAKMFRRVERNRYIEQGQDIPDVIKIPKTVKRNWNQLNHNERGFFSLAFMATEVIKEFNVKTKEA